MSTLAPTPGLAALPALLIPRHEAPLQRELYALGWRNMRSSQFSPLAVVAIVFIAYREAIDPRALMLWLALMACALVSVFLVRRAYRQGMAPDGGGPSAPSRWLLLHYAVIGLAWGGLSLLLMPQQPIHNAVMLVIFLGVVAIGAGNIGVPSLAGYYTMLVPGCALVLARLPHGFGPDALAVQVGVVFYALVMAYAARNAHQTMVRAIRLQFANEELLAQKVAEAQRAERANREKSLFLAAASHDLRQPVHALLLLIEALRQRSTDAGVRELVGYVQEAGTTIGALFSALMELSRLESGSERAEPADHALAPLLQAVLERQRPEARRRGLGLSLRLGASARDAWVRTDRLLLERILDNLLANALRYTAQGRVLVSARRRGGVVLLEVRDTGVGIAAGEVEAIFEPYYQVANPERDRRKGLGLGLAIVRRTAQLLQHPLALRSVPGRGSCFSLGVPVVQAQATAPAGQQPRAPALPRLAGRRVLVVDDDTMVLQAMRVLFQGWGVDCRCTEGEAEALSLLRRGDWLPEAILCDFRLRGARNGIEVLEALAGFCPQAVAILQTGELAAQVRDAAEDAGYLVLAKPVAGDALARTLEALLPPHA